MKSNLNNIVNTTTKPHNHRDFNYHDLIKSQEDEITSVTHKLIEEQKYGNVLKQELNSYMEENDFNNLDDNIDFYTNMLKQS